MLLQMGKKETVPTSKVAKATGDETKEKLSGNSLCSLLGAQVFTMKEVLFIKTLKLEILLLKRGQKDKLSYISLLKQIEAERDKGYSDKEIVNVVLIAITPGLYLQNVLETTENLILSRLMKFLQPHFVERYAADLCQHL